MKLRQSGVADLYSAQDQAQRQSTGCGMSELLALNAQYSGAVTSRRSGEEENGI